MGRGKGERGKARARERAKEKVRGGEERKRSGATDEALSWSGVEKSGAERRGVWRKERRGEERREKIEERRERDIV